MFRFALAIVEIGLVLYCLIDCIQSPEAQIRNLPRWAWIVLILLLPDIGAIAWLVAGRPRAGASRGTGSWPSPRTAGGPDTGGPARGPDDDASFLAGLRRADDEHKDVLRQWEDDLRRREDQLRRANPGDDRDGREGTDGVPPAAPA